MITNEVSKHVKLYTPQFDEISQQVSPNMNFHRLSMDLDNVMFRTKYMMNNGLDTDKFDIMRKEWVDKYNQFTTEVAYVVTYIIAIIIKSHRKYIVDNIKDLLVSDLKMTPEYTEFVFKLYSDNESIIQKIDNAFSEEGITNLYPTKMFRYHVDSYNDGIVKAYPELFKNKTQTKLGKGADQDIFCHSVTLQVGERCSLNCTYCFEAGTYVMMADKTTKRIEDIRTGDMVMGFSIGHNNGYTKWVDTSFFPTKVTNVMNHIDRTVTLEHPYIGELHVTPNHQVLTHNGKYKRIDELNSSTSGIMRYNAGTAMPIYVYDVIRKFNREPVRVYNITTESGNYIANKVLVHNCYQFNKSEMRMTFDTAKTFIDNLLEDKYTYVNQYNSPAIILEFIGGEPLMEIKLINQVYEYFLKRTYELNHPYFEMHRLSICSNGMQYFDEDVQSFFKKYSSRISFNISIDGNKKLHDSCRVQPNGEGSYNVDIAALNHYNKHYSKERNSKMTLAPSNIKYLFDSVKDFIDSGTNIINLNCVFEEGWKLSHAAEEYKQLKKLADYIVDNDLEHVYISLFRETPDGPLSKEQDNTSCGGAGAMLAVRPNGDIYPCIRYMPSSVGNNVKDLKMGNVKDGMVGREEGSDVLNMLDNITRRSSTTDICYNCPIANSCMSCIALGHTVFGTPGKRTTFICNMVKAEHLANVYYWNLVALKHPEWKLNIREILTSEDFNKILIGEYNYDELSFLILMASSAKTGVSTFTIDDFRSWQKNHTLNNSLGI